MIQERAMLAQLTFHQWGAKKQDKAVTAEVEAKHNAHNAGRFNKDLVDKSLLEPIRTLMSATREAHYKMTHAWNDNGQRLLPSTLFMDYTTMVRSAKTKLSTLKLDLATKYPIEVQAARVRLGSMYDPDDYPSPNDILDKFDIQSEFGPVPAANDFRVDVGNEAVEEIKASIPHNVVLKQAKAIEATYHRIREVVSKVEERLSDEKAIFKDTLITNVADLRAVLQGLNITNDPLITELYEDMAALIEPPSQLRSNKRLRAQVAQRAGAVLSKLP